MNSGWIYTGIRLLLLIHPFIFSFLFLSSFQTLKIFVTLFSGTVRPIWLKLGYGIHMNSGWMYPIYWNQAAAAYSSLYFFIFLSLQCSNIKNFRHTLLRNCEAWKIETWYTHEQWVDVSCIFLSNFLAMKTFLALSSGTVSLQSWNLVHTWTKSAVRLLLLIHPFIISLSLQLSSVDIFCNIFLRNCEA